MLNEVFDDYNNTTNVDNNTSSIVSYKGIEVLKGFLNV
jgi:hypothetical protein